MDMERLLTSRGARRIDSRLGTPLEKQALPSRSRRACVCFAMPEADKDVIVEEPGLAVAARRTGGRRRTGQPSSDRSADPFLHQLSVVAPARSGARTDVDVGVREALDVDHLEVQFGR